MKIIRKAGLWAAVAGALAGVPAVASPAAATSSQGSPLPQPARSSTNYVEAPSRSGRSMLAREIAGVMRRGLPYARASRAISVQGEVAQADLVSKIEAAMGSSFGGVWFAPAAAQLDVGVTSPQGRRAAERAAAQAGLARDVRTVPVRTSWAHLIAAQKRWNRRLARLFARTEVSTALTANNNAVAITLSSSVPAKERAAIGHEASSGDVNVVVQVARSRNVGVERLAETKCLSFLTELANCDKPITSGVRIKAQGGGTCTAGPLAVSQSNWTSTWVLTAGHCISETGGVGKKWYAFNTSEPKAEKLLGEASKVNFNANGDYGAITLSEGPGLEWGLGGNTPVYAVVAEWKSTEEKSYPVIGEREPVVLNANCGEGQVSGEVCGEVVATNRTFVVEGTLVEKLAEDKRFAGEAALQKGDSGGPYMLVGLGRVATMEGTLVGKTEVGGNPVFEPLKTTLAGLSLELLTTANENRAKLSVLPANLSFKFTSKAGENTRLETLGGKKLECKKVTAAGEATSERLGSIELKLVECEEPSLKVKCTGLEDTTGNITIKGASWHIRHLLPATEGVDLIILPPHVHFACTIVLFLELGCFASMDMLTKSGGTSAVGSLLSSIFVNFLQEKGDQKPLEIDTDNSLAMEACELKTKEGSGGAYESSGLLGSGLIEACLSGGKECSFLLDLTGKF